MQAASIASSGSVFILPSYSNRINSIDVLAAPSFQPSTLLTKNKPAHLAARRAAIGRRLLPQPRSTTRRAAAPAPPLSAGSTGAKIEGEFKIFGLAGHYEVAQAHTHLLLLPQVIFEQRLTGAANW